MSHPMNSSPLEINILDEAEFFDSLNKDISEVDNDGRIALTTMSFNPSEPRVSQIVQSLHAAASRNTEIKFGVDAYTFLVNNSTSSIGPSLLPLPFGQKIFKQRRQALEELNQQSSVQLSILNQPNRKLTNPYAGRSHIKTMVVGDVVYVASPNLHSTHRRDIAVRFASSPVADKLYETVSKMVDSGSTRETFEGEDQTWQLDDKTQLVIDAGARGKSAIMEKALYLIDSANEKLVMSSPYFPRRTTLSHLGQASIRGTDVLAFYNDPSVQGSIFGSYPEILAINRSKRYLNLDSFTRKLPSHLNLHSKALASESSAIIGSHNFDQRGVNFGTAEMSVVSSDSVFAARLGDFLLSQVGQVKMPEEPTELLHRAA